MATPHPERRRNRSIIPVLLGAALAPIGLVLAAGGAWLAALGGSVYYLLAGLGLLVSGALLVRGKPAGARIYVLVYGLTLVWAVWEVGLRGWALVPRIVAPTVLLILVLLVLPLLQPDRWRWRTALARRKTIYCCTKMRRCICCTTSFALI